MKKYVLFAALCCIWMNAAAQQKKYTDRDYAREPVWREMIADTNANFFETERAFKIYWKHREKPEGENEEIGEHAKREKTLSKRMQKKIQQDNNMRMAVKKYERWHQRMLPYVQPDGRILTPSEQIKLWESQQNKK